MTLEQDKESQQCKPMVTLTGTAKEGAVGPLIGLVDIGANESAYIFRVALPGVGSNKSKFSDKFIFLHAKYGEKGFLSWH